MFENQILKVKVLLLFLFIYFIFTLNYTVLLSLPPYLIFSLYHINPVT